MELKISGEVWYWRGPSPFYFVTVPKKQGEKIKEIASLVTYGWGGNPCYRKVGKFRVDHIPLSERRDLRRANQESSSRKRGN